MTILVRSSLLVVLACASLFAQFETAVVLGTVRDSSQSHVAGARVTLENIGTGIRAVTDTDDNGNYLFNNVKIGAYKVSVEKQGFSTAVASNFQVDVNARQRVDMTLTVGQVSESVQVNAAVMSIEADSSDRGQVINQKQIVELPLNGRNYADLALLATGVRKSDYAFANPPRDGAFNVNGQRSVFNNFLMDGVDNNAYGTSNQGFSSQVVQATPDALAEFKVVTSLPSAEYGRSSGAIINAAFKSGTNQFHGSAWEFLRNTDLNAVGFFKPATGKPSLQRNQFGATIGGPIVKNRFFFFADYEGFREINKFPSFSSIPTVADRLGIFSVPVRNPLTGEVFVANTPIPIAKMTPFAVKVLNDLPIPNAGTGRSNDFNNLRRDQNFNDKFDLKLDGQLNDKMTAFVRLSQRKSNYLQAPDLPGPSGGNGNGYIRALNQAMTAGYTYTVTPTQLFEVRMGISRTLGGKSPVGVGGADILATYGISGLPTDSRIAGGLNPQSVSGFTAFGRQSTNPQWQYPNVWNPKFVYSLLKHGHSLKAGFEFMVIHTEDNDVNPLYGQDLYNGNFSCIPTAPAKVCTPAQVSVNSTSAASYALSDFMFGARSDYQLASLFVAQLRKRMYFGFLQDDWKVNSKLTVNIGLRYEYGTPYWEATNRLSNIDPVSGTIIQAKDGGIEDRSLVKPDRNDWAPRLGIAYSLNPKTVIRTGYGISYIHFNRVGSGDLLPLNGPQVVSALVNQADVFGTPSFLPTQAGYPAGLVAPSKLNPHIANLIYLPPDTRDGYVQNWTFTVQRELFKDTVIDLGYVGNKSTNLVTIVDYNQARPLAAGETLATSPLLSRRPFQAFGPITTAWAHAFANYNAFQARVEHRGKKGLYFLNSFVYGKAIDNSGQSLESQGAGGHPSPQNFYNLAAEKSVSDFNQKFNNTTSFIFELPFGRGRRYGSSMNRIVDLGVGGWQLSAINNAWTGQPLNLSYTPNASQQVTVTLSDFRGGPSYRPNVNGPALTPGGNIDNYINPLTVTVPTDITQPFGNAGRNAVIGYGFNQLDLGIGKTFSFSERIRLQFRSEMFNAFNHTNFRNANLNRSAAGFGQVRAAFPARQVQFALRLMF